MFIKRMFFIFCFYFANSQFIKAQVSSTSQVNSPRSNPSISVNVLMLERAGNKGHSAISENPNGFQFQEIETRFTSNIDTYFRGDVVLAVEKEDGEFIVEPEEAFVETLSLPGFTVKAGKFYALFGRHNHLHTHSFPFIDKPLTNEILLGEEGLNETGLAVSYLVPTPWYFEVVGQGFSATNEILFKSSTQDDIAGILFIKNLWDLSDAATFEFDLGYGNGKNSFDGTTHLYNASVTYKRRPIKKSTNYSFSWTTEFLQSYRENATEDVRVGGISSWVQWQFARRWWLQGRGEYLGLPKPNTGIARKYSALVGFVMTETSALRLQYDNINQSSEEKDEYRVSLQLNISLGTHPAHNY